jgi:ABC-type transport system substrate-binding protein
LQEAERLLTDAGFTKRTDGFAPGYFVDASGQRLSFELRAFAADPGPTEAAILASQWKNFGIDAPIYVIPAAQSQSLEQVSAYPGVRIEQTGLNGTTPIGKLQSQFVATAENRWSGVNRGGWVNADFDRLANVYVAALDRAQRNQAAVQAFKVASDELGDIPLYYLSLASAYTSDLEGMVGGYNGDTAWDNVFQWRWVR